MSAYGAPRRKRHPLRNTIIVLVILAALLISGYLVADSLARSFATSFVATGVSQELGGSADDVHVNLGKGSILAQVVQKHIKTMHVTIGGFSSGTLTGDAVFDAKQVPLNTSDAVGSIVITVKIGATGLLGLVDAKAGSTATVAFSGNNLRISTVEKVLGKKLPVSIDYVPTASGNNLVLTPADILVGTKQYTPKQFAASKYGPFTKGLIVTRTQCLSAGLPATMKLTGIGVADQKLVVTASGTGISLGSLATKGTCPA